MSWFHIWLMLGAVGAVIGFIAKHIGGKTLSAVMREELQKAKQKGVEAKVATSAYMVVGLVIGIVVSVMLGPISLLLAAYELFRAMSKKA